MEYVLFLFYDYIDQLKNNVLDDKLYEYLKKNNKISFMISEVNKDVERISSNWQKQKIQSLFSYDYDYSSMDVQQI